jgi:mannose-6-phosphate isomerase-like protein (cupin superfamily)
MIKVISPSSLDKKYLDLKTYTATPINIDFSKVVVNKPWGGEYLMFSDPQTEIWNLFIKQFGATSMHCHPNKKTVLIVVGGRVIFSSLNESLELEPLDAIVINSGTFHSTQAISKEGARVLELEVPPMKHDLVRLEDMYGRTQDGYEGSGSMKAESKYARFSKSDFGRMDDFYDNKICFKTMEKGKDIPNFNGDRVLAAILSGAVISRLGEELFKAGDIVAPEELRDLDCAFKNVSIMFLSRKKA